MATEIIKRLKMQNKILKIIIAILLAILFLFSIYAGNIKIEHLPEGRRTWAIGRHTTRIQQGTGLEIAQ